MAIRRWRPSRDRPVPVIVDGAGSFQLHLHAGGDRWISGAIRAGIAFEQHVCRALLALTPPGATFLDVGANIGWFTVIGSRLVGREGRVIAYEPDPENLRLLRANIAANSCRNVVVHAAAAGATRGRASLWRSPENAGDHRLELVSERIASVAVDIRPVDDDVDPRAGVTVVKIDTQGSEVAVLSGMRRLYAAESRLRIVAEFWPYGLGRCGATADELIELVGVGGRLLWLVRHDCSVAAVSAADLRLLARTEFAPDCGGHADVVSLAPDDVGGHARMATLAASAASG